MKKKNLHSRNSAKHVFQYGTLFLCVFFFLAQFSEFSEKSIAPAAPASTITKKKRGR